MKPYVVGDTPTLKVTCVNEETGSAIDLSGSTVTLRWSINGSTPQNGVMSVDNASAGVASRRWGTAEIDAEGRLLFAVLIEDSQIPPNKYTSQEFRRDIRRSLT